MSSNPTRREFLGSLMVMPMAGTLLTDFGITSNQNGPELLDNLPPNLDPFKEPTAVMSPGGLPGWLYDPGWWYYRMDRESTVVIGKELHGQVIEVRDRAVVIWRNGQSYSSYTPNHSAHRTIKAYALNGNPYCFWGKEIVISHIKRRSHPWSPAFGTMRYWPHRQETRSQLIGCLNKIGAGSVITLSSEPNAFGFHQPKIEVA